MNRCEERVRDALSELMEIDASQISLTRPFSEQGVDSLIGLRLTGKLEELLGVEVELEWLFDHPNIHELSRFLDEHFGELDTTLSQPKQDRRLSG